MLATGINNIQWIVPIHIPSAAAICNVYVETASRSITPLFVIIPFVDPIENMFPLFPNSIE